MDWQGSSGSAVWHYFTQQPATILSLPRVLLLVLGTVGRWKSKEKNSVAHFISLNLRIIIQRGLGLCWMMVVLAVE